MSVGYFYFTTHDGDAFEVPLSHLTSTSSTPVEAIDVTSNPPVWLKRLIRPKTSTRFDGIGTLPPHSSVSNGVKPWNEQYVLLHVIIYLVISFYMFVLCVKFVVEGIYLSRIPAVTAWLW